MQNSPRLILASGLSFLALAACGQDNSGPAITKDMTHKEVQDVVKITKVDVYAACLMRNSDGNIWYVSPPSKAEVSMSTMSAFTKGYETKVRAERGEAELGEYPSSPSCFIGGDKAGAQKKLDTYTTSAREPGNKIVTIRYPD